MLFSISVGITGMHVIPPARAAILAGSQVVRVLTLPQARVPRKRHDHRHAEEERAEQCERVGGKQAQCRVVHTHGYTWFVLFHEFFYYF